jgi:Aldo/keto reductase family
LDIEDPKVGLLKTCRELGVTVVAYSPLGRGFLTGQVKSRDDLADDDFRKISPRFSEENFHNNLELVHSLTKIAEKKGCTPGQLSLAWLLAQGEDVPAAFEPVNDWRLSPSLEPNQSVDSTKTLKQLTLHYPMKILLRFESSLILRKSGEIGIPSHRNDWRFRYPAMMQGNILADTPPLNKWIAWFKTALIANWYSLPNWLGVNTSVCTPQHALLVVQLRMPTAPGVSIDEQIAP